MSSECVRTYSSSSCSRGQASAALRAPRTHLELEEAIAVLVEVLVPGPRERRRNGARPHTREQRGDLQA